MTMSEKVWTARIDAIPQVYRAVEFMHRDGRILQANVLPATFSESRAWTGIGCEVVYQAGMIRYLGEDVRLWRYLY